jgi:hypothetical protein
MEDQTSNDAPGASPKAEARSALKTSVARAPAGRTDLAQLRGAVEKEFLTLDEHDQNVCSVMAKLENGFLYRPGTFSA